MDLQGRSVALYGRFSAGARERLQQAVLARGGKVARDLTSRSDLFVVGAQASALIDNDRLGQRLVAAEKRGMPIMGERRFAASMAGEPEDDRPALPLATALAPTSLTEHDVQILAAFDLIVLEAGKCRFGDAGILRTASELMAQRRSRAEVVRILARARDLAPLGRHKIVLTPQGNAALQWDNGLTTLEGQGVLPLEEPAGLDAYFEEAELHEASGDREQAATLYERCARADKSDAIAPFNLGNIRLAQGRYGEAESAYRMALGRDRDFVEAHYNLALVLEALERPHDACDELARVLVLDPAHADAWFNRAQLLMNGGSVAEAKTHYERYLALDPPEDWAQKARKAITYCTAQLHRR